MQPIQKCDKVVKQFFFEITTPYLGKFDTNYNTFRNVENFKFGFFKEQNFVKKTIESSRVFYSSKSKFQISQLLNIHVWKLPM